MSDWWRRRFKSEINFEVAIKIYKNYSIYIPKSLINGGKCCNDTTPDISYVTSTQYDLFPYNRKIIQ